MKAIILCACVLLAGCATEDQAQRVAIATASQHCAAEGKSFVYRRTDKTPGAVPGFITDVTVSGTCQ